LSTISPKDAYQYLHEEDDEEDEEILIKRNVSFLCVGVPVYHSSEVAAQECLQILFHSERVMLDIQFKTDEKQINLILLDWLPTNLKSETRCLIFENRLIAISQYYVDFNNCYTQKIEIIYEKVIQYVHKFMQANFVSSNCISLDLDIKDNGEIYLIELNDYGPSDKCFFKKEELEEFIKTPISQAIVPEFRFRKDGNIQSYKKEIL